MYVLFICFIIIINEGLGKLNDRPEVIQEEDPANQLMAKHSQPRIRLNCPKGQNRNGNNAVGS